MNNLPQAVGLAMTVCFAWMIGCTGSQTPSANPPAETTDSTAHAHPTEGPHHGDLIELGNEEYHAELLHDDKSVTIYVLDSSATKQVAISEESITINSTVDGAPQQFSLAAKPDEGEADGKSSRFVSTDASLVALIDSETATHRLALSIDGKSYRGDIAHRHDHDH